jgi:hypothetical protein
MSNLPVTTAASPAVQRTPEQQAAYDAAKKKQREAAMATQKKANADDVDFNLAVVAAKQIRGAMKDPDSFRLTSAFIVAGD